VNQASQHQPTLHQQRAMVKDEKLFLWRAITRNHPALLSWFFRDLLGEIHWLKHIWYRFGAPFGFGQMFFGRCECAYSRGLGESVARGDRRGRELWFGSPSPPLTSPREYTAQICVWFNKHRLLSPFG
jgi:hypothetical protein